MVTQSFTGLLHQTGAKGLEGHVHHAGLRVLAHPSALVKETDTHLPPRHASHRLVDFPFDELLFPLIHDTTPVGDSPFDENLLHALSPLGQRISPGLTGMKSWNCAMMLILRVSITQRT